MQYCCWLDLIIDFDCSLVILSGHYQRDAGVNLKQGRLA